VAIGAIGVMRAGRLRRQTDQPAEAADQACRDRASSVQQDRKALERQTAADILP
jgi:hypothetical protein